MILSKEVTPLAQQVAAALSPAGAGMWSTPLTSKEDPQGETSHFISTGNISEEFAAMVPQQVYEQEDDLWVLAETIPGSPEMITEACNAAGLEVTLEEIQSIFLEADVTDQDPFVAMQRLGLVLKQEPLEDSAA